MPVISTFFGIIIRMFFDDHEPPHFHVEYQGQFSTFDFSGELLAGELRSARARRLDRSVGIDTMRTLPRVIEARYVSGYRIELLFNTGVRKTIDFSHWLRGPVFEPLRNREAFRKFYIGGGTICWPNGADIAPETLHSTRGISRRAT